MKQPIKKHPREEWIDDIWPSYHDNCHDESLMSYFNNRTELERLNNYRNEDTPMYWFNRMILKALYERNKGHYEK